MDLIAALLDLCNQKSQPVIAIDGPAGAGKTTLAHEAFLALSPKMSVNVIHMDDLYDGWENALTDDLTQILTHLVTKHKAQEPMQFSKYNWTTSEFETAEMLAPADLLILEGVGSGDKSLQDQFAALIWIDIDPEVGVKRVIERDGTGVEIQMQKWLGTQQQYFSQHSTREKADFILTT